MKSTEADKLELLWEIPLAVISYLTHKLLKTVLDALIERGQSKDNYQNIQEWIPLDKSVLNKKGFLFFILLNAPRWNVHAVTAMLALKANQRLNILVPKSDNTNPSFSIVIKNEHGEYCVLDQLGVHGNIPVLDASDCKTMVKGSEIITMPKGHYKLGARYYDVAENTQLPDIIVDENSKINGIEIASNTNEFYSELINVDCALFRALGFHIHTMLYLRKFLGENFVRKNFLPVGNPESEFIFGHMFPNQKLIIELDARILNEFFVYCCIYNRSSLPMAWFKVTTSRLKTDNVSEKAVYLFRFCRRSKGAIFDDALLNIHTC